MLPLALPAFLKQQRLLLLFLLFLATFRSRLTRTPLGDHAIFVRRQYFLELEDPLLRLTQLDEIIRAMSESADAD